MDQQKHEPGIGKSDKDSKRSAKKKEENIEIITWEISSNA